MAAGTDNSTVKITIDVIDANSGAVVSQITKNLSGMGTAGAAAGAQTAQGLAAVGNAGAVAGNAVAQGMKHGGEHALSALDNVRLLRDDLGIRIPRAMEKFIASSQTAMTVVGGLGSVMVGIGALEIFARVGMQAYEFYKHLTDVNSELQKYAVNAATAAQQKLFDNGSIETTRSLVRQTGEEIDRINKQRVKAGVGEDGKGSVKQYIPYFLATTSALNPSESSVYTEKDEKKLVAAKEQNDAAKERTRILQQQTAVENLQAEGAARAAGLVGAAARSAKVQSDEAVAALKRQQAMVSEQEHYQDSVASRAEAKRAGKKENELPTLYRPDVHAGEAEYNDAIRKAHEQAGAESTADARKQHEETLHLQAEAQGAELRGEAKFVHDLTEQQRQLTHLRDETTVREAEYYKRRAANFDKYWAEYHQRLVAEHAETARMQAEAAQGGNTGMARIDAQTRSRLSGIAKEAPGFSDPATQAAREASVRQEGQAEQLREAQSFAQRLAQFDEGHANSTMSANARIDLDTKRTVAEIEKAWQEEYGQLNALDQRRVQSRQAVNAAEAKIQAEAALQKSQVRQQLLNETEKAEAEGARRGLTRDQEQRQAIVDEYNERFHVLEELRARDADNADLYRRQEIAAEQVKNGKLIEQQREMRDRLAGQIKGFMTNPLEALKRQGEDAASKYAADLILKATSGLGAAGSKHGGLFDLPFGNKTKKDATHAVSAAASSVSAASTTLTAGTATIHVGVATFTGMGTAGSAAMPAQAALAATGGAGGSLAGLAGSGSSNTLRAMAGGLGSSSSTTSGSWGDDLGTTGTSGPSALGFSSTGGPGIAAIQAGMGIEDAGAPPSLLGSAQNAMGMGQDLTGLGKQLGLGDAGSGLTSLAGKAGISKSALGKAGGALGGAMGLFSAAEGNGGFGGALNGAMSGAQLGSMAGPIGTAVGAAAGAILGFIGLGGRSKAREYYDKQVRPRISNDITQYGMGAMDYQAAYEDLISLDKEARQQTKQWGMGGKTEWNDHIHPDIIAAQRQLDREQKAGRNKYGMTGAQFHNGGIIGDFGTMATTGNQGWVHAERGEFMVQQQAVPSHYQALQLMQSGASHADMASYYGGSGASSTAPAQASSDVNLHFHSHDARGTYQLFMDNKHVIREAMNQSYAENSGGSDFG